MGVFVPGKSCVLPNISNTFDAMFIWKMNSKEKEKNDNYNEDKNKKEYEEGEGE